MRHVNLDQYKKVPALRGRGILVETLWILVQFLVVSSFQPFSAIRVAALRLFGAKIGKGVLIKSHVKIKYPWKLQIGNHTWIGECAWIDNLDMVSIGNHCCVSQGVYICTGNHNWTSQQFELDYAPVILEDCTWLCARSSVAPGVRVGEGAVLTIGSVAVNDLASWEIHAGNPAHATKKRVINKSTAC